jgi:hypothetical protein
MLSSSVSIALVVSCISHGPCPRLDRLCLCPTGCLVRPFPTASSFKLMRQPECHQKRRG